jgi:glutamyl-tRNA reductase
MSQPNVFVIGATHHVAPIEVREKLTLNPEQSAALQQDLAALAGLKEFTVVSTCNRIEIYGVAAHSEVVTAVQATFCRHQRVADEEFEKFRLALRDQSAVGHLLEVAAGLDSQMVGETEIFGQIKGAYAAAQERGATGPVLNRIFQKAFQSAKMARSQTGITEGQISVANVAVELAANIFGNLEKTRVLLLGAGDIGEKTAKAFRSRGAGSLVVASRRMERAMELASELGATALPFGQHEGRLAEFDIVVGSTSAPDTVVSAHATTAAMRHRPARPLFFIDLALPRDIDPGVAALENVFLYNLDDLAKIASENLAARTAEIAKCRALLGGRAEALWQHVAPKLNGAGAGPAGAPAPGHRAVP